MPREFINQLTVHRMNNMKVQLCSFLIGPLNPWRWRTTLTQWHRISSQKTSVLHINLLYVTWMLDIISTNAAIKICWQTMACDSHVTTHVRMNQRKKVCKSLYSSYGYCKLTLLPTYTALFQIFSFDFFLIIFSQWTIWMFFVVWVCVYTLHTLWNHLTPTKKIFWLIT